MILNEHSILSDSFNRSPSVSPPSAFGLLLIFETMKLAARSCPSNAVKIVSVQITVECYGLANISTDNSMRVATAMIQILCFDSQRLAVVKSRKYDEVFKTPNKVTDFATSHTTAGMPVCTLRPKAFFSMGHSSKKCAAFELLFVLLSIVIGISY